MSERDRGSSDRYARIYAVVRRIPRGRVASYGQVAALAGMPGRPRLAGYALYASGIHHALPWHRVVGAGGRLTIGRLDPGAALTQRIRLESEGVTFDGRGVIDDLERFTWRAARLAMPPKPRPVPRRPGRRRAAAARRDTSRARAPRRGPPPR